MDGPLRQVGEEAPQLPAGEVGADRDESRGAQGEPHQDPPAQGVGEGEVLGMGEEREVVDGGDARDPEGERARVRRREEDVERVLPRGRGHQPLLPGEAARAAVAEGALADGGVVEQGIERGRAVEVADEPVARLAPVADQVAQVPTGPGGAARELTRVDPDDDRPSVQGPSGRRRACGRRCRAQSKRRLRSRPRRRMSEASAPSSSSRSTARARPLTSCGGTRQAASPATSARAEPEEQTTGQARGHRLDHRQAETLLERRQHQHRRGGHQGADVELLQVPRGHDLRPHPAAALRPVGPGAGEDERGQAPPPRQGHVGHDQGDEVLPLLGASQVQDAAARQAQPAQRLVDLAFRRGFAVGRVDAVRGDRDLLLGHVQQAPRLGRGVLGHAQDAVGAPHVVPDERHVVAPHLAVHHLGVLQEEEIVHGHDALAPPAGDEERAWASERGRARRRRDGRAAARRDGSRRRSTRGPAGAGPRAGRSGPTPAPGSAP